MLPCTMLYFASFSPLLAGLKLTEWVIRQKGYFSYFNAICLLELICYRRGIAVDAEMLAK